MTVSPQVASGAASQRTEAEARADIQERRCYKYGEPGDKPCRRGEPCDCTVPRVGNGRAII